VGGDLHCIYPSNLIIEGFLCPDEVPERHDFEDEVVCSASDELTQEAVAKIREEGYELEPLDEPVNPGDPCDTEGDTADAADGCNTCECDGGRWSCTEIACPELCTPGDRRDADDGCNTCECDDDGAWSCTEIACPEPCTPGDRRTADDGCNTCECDEDGTWVCTEIECTACADLPPDACTDDLCETIRAQPLQDDGEGGLCLDPGADPVPQTCIDFGDPCTALDVTRYAASPEDPETCWYFSFGGCVPSDWTPCEDDEPGQCVSDDECADLDIDACVGDNRCRTINGVASVDDGQGGVCFPRDGEPAPLGCTDGDALCEDLPTTAAPPEDPEACASFADSCFPAGWTECRGEIRSCLDFACEELSADACNDDVRCNAFNGFPVQDNGMGGLCIDSRSDATPFGCGDADRNCDADITLAASPDDPGNCILFQNGCIPADWTTRECEGLQVDDECSVDALCENLDVDVCALDDRCRTFDSLDLVDDGEGGQCVEFGADPVPRGCGSTATPCGDFRSFAAPPEDPEDCHYFSETCFPVGWTACEDSWEACQ
jgi:hypothetical protein